MAIFVFVLDLVPTSLGVLYALSGAVAVALAVVAFALGVLIRRIDALAKLVRQAPAPLGDAGFPQPGAVKVFLSGADPLPAKVCEDPLTPETGAGAEPAELAEDGEDPINE